MNFFEQQEKARRRTRVLLVYYALAVVLIIGAFYFASRAVVGVGLSYAGSEREIRVESDGSPEFSVFAWDPLWMMLTAVVSLIVIAGGTLYRRASLSEGGAAVARSAGGREVLAHTRDLQERRLMNIVEEMALASGIPVPRVFVLDDEQGVNAFAAGFSLNDAAVAVTRGALERLTRDELQGVVAHEFSHVLNGDMRLNSWLIGMLFGILVTSVAGMGLMRMLGHVRVSGRKKDGGGLVLMLFLAGLALWVIGSVGVFFARMIQSSVSREREYLADASAVQFTRNPAGLAGALKRIGAARVANAMRCPNRSELSHLLFASGSAAGFEGLFATHPPLLVRICRIEPSFTGDFKPWVQRAAPFGRAEESAADQEESRAFEGDAGVFEMGTGAAADFLQGLGPDMRVAMSQPFEAAGVLYALLLSEDDGIRLRQRGRIVALEGQPLAAAAEQWRQAMRQMDRASQRMVAELAVEGVRQRDPAARATCTRLARELADADGEISLFEFLLQGRLARRLYPSSDMADVRRKPLPPAQARLEAAVVLGTLAYAGQEQEGELADSAWRAGVALVPSFAIADLQLERASCTLDMFDRALTRMEGLSPLAKGELIAACSAVVRADGALTSDETELLRAVADRLDMPLPPE